MNTLPYTTTDIGMAKSALDIHETIGNWERIIQCCKKLEKSTKAESLIRERLEVWQHHPKPSTDHVLMRELHFFFLYSFSKHKKRRRDNVKDPFCS